MKRGQCGFGVDESTLSEHDRRELDRFRDLLRRVGQAKKAGVPHADAMRTIYPDVYDADEGGAS